MRERPNPFSSAEGCFLSRTVWAVAFLTGFLGGTFLGNELWGIEGGTWGGVFGGVLAGFTPWRRGLLRLLKARKRR